VGYILKATTDGRLAKVLANEDEMVKSQIMVTAGEVAERLMETPLQRVAVEPLARQGYHIVPDDQEGALYTAWSSM
jgi:hypothetical protein